MFQQRVVEYQLIFNFFRTNHQFYVFIKQTSRYHNILFFSTRCSLFINFWTKRIRKLLFCRCFFYLEYHCFFSFDFLQLFSLINNIIRRDRDRRCIRIALSARFRCDNVRFQSDNDLRRVAFDIIQFDVHFFQRQRDLFFHC